MLLLVFLLFAPCFFFFFFSFLLFFLCSFFLLLFLLFVLFFFFLFFVFFSFLFFFFSFCLFFFFLLFFFFSYLFKWCCTRVTDLDPCHSAVFRWSTVDFDCARTVTILTAAFKTQLRDCMKTKLHHGGGSNVLWVYPLLFEPWLLHVGTSGHWW